MKKLTWWFRIVGIFYLLLTLMNVYALFLGGTQMLADTLPAPMNTDSLAVRAFSDAWMVFVFELGVLGAMALAASRAPQQNRIMGWVIIWAEVFRGILADGSGSRAATPLPTMPFSSPSTSSSSSPVSCSCARQRPRKKIHPPKEKKSWQ